MPLAKARAFLIQEFGRRLPHRARGVFLCKERTEKIYMQNRASRLRPDFARILRRKWMGLAWDALDIAALIENCIEINAACGRAHENMRNRIHRTCLHKSQGLGTGVNGGLPAPYLYIVGIPRAYGAYLHERKCCPCFSWNLSLPTRTYACTFPGCSPSL